MAQLLDLPSELLVLIFESLGGRNLRRNASNLTICQKWYDSAHEIYLSGLDTSEMHISGCDLKDLAGKWSYPDQRLLAHKNTCKLYIRQLGHWWDENHKTQIMNGFQIGLDDVPPCNYRTPEGIRATVQWQKTVLNPVLDELFKDLSHFEVLEEVALEASLERSAELGPQWEFLNSSVVANFLDHLPITHDLTNLTLDLGPGLNYDEPTNAHVCEHVARILPRIQNVRLRLKLICPSVFPTLEDLVATGTGTRLKSLIIKLYVPYFEGIRSINANGCFGTSGFRPWFIAAEIVSNALTFINNIAAIRNPTSTARTHRPLRSQDIRSDHGLEMLRITYPQVPYPEAANLPTIDCLTMHKLSVERGLTYFGGNNWPCWFEDGRGEKLLDYGLVSCVEEELGNGFAPASESE